MLTFSKAAALSMRSRFYKTTEGRYPPIAFGTFHSIYYQIIRSGGDDKVTLITPTRRIRLLQELLRQYFPLLSEPDDADILAEVICRSREQGRPCPKGDIKDCKAIARCVYAYETYLAENHLIDYDGMILLCRDLLRSNPELLRSMQTQYAFLLVDEFQDISKTQYEILRMLYDRKDKTPHALFVVGDDDQSIYGFRGADPSICRDYLRDYPAARQILLSVNYRSVPPIVQNAGLIIEQNKNRIRKTIVSGRSLPKAKPERPTTLPRPAALSRTTALSRLTAAGNHAAPTNTSQNTDLSGQPAPTRSTRAVSCKAFRSRQEQWDYLVKVITAMDKAARKESAIICRTNRQLQFVRKAMARAGLLPAELAESENPWIRKVHTLYQYYMTFGAEVRQDCIHKRTYERIMNVPERFLLRESMPQETMTRRAFLGTYPPGTAAHTSMDMLVRCAEQLCDLPERQRVRFFRTVIGIEQDLVQRANGNPQMRQQICEAFEDLAANPGAVYTDESAGEQPRRSSSANAQTACGVALITMHACKGLEYDNVYLPDLNEGMIPTRKAHTPDAIEEERRLFYVAMTRAKEHLELLYVQGTAENPETPTRFLLPLGIGPRYSQ